MSQNSAPLSVQLHRVRAQAQQQLSALSGVPAGECKEVYLFEKDVFCGVRFALGAVHAIWKTGSDELSYYRDGDLITLDSHGDNGLRRAA